MRYSIEPKFRKYIKGYGFLSFTKKIGNKYGKKLLDTANKTGIDAAKKSYIPPEKRQIIDDLRLFWILILFSLYKNGLSQNCKFSCHNLWW